MLGNFRKFFRKTWQSNPLCCRAHPAVRRTQGTARMNQRRRDMKRVQRAQRDFRMATHKQTGGALNDQPVEWVQPHLFRLAQILKADERAFSRRRGNVSRPLFGENRGTHLGQRQFRGPQRTTGKVLFKPFRIPLADEQLRDNGAVQIHWDHGRESRSARMISSAVGPP
jgi:hypothetical protein